MKIAHSKPMLFVAVVVWLGWAGFGIAQENLGAPSLGPRIQVYEPRAVPSSGPFSTKQYNEMVLAYNRRTLSEAYNKVGMKDPRWDDQVVAHLDDLANHLTFRDEMESDAIRTARLRKTRQILAAGCRDPLLIYVLGFCLAESKKSEEAMKCFRRALADWEAKPNYPYVRMVFAPARIARIHFAHGGVRNAEMDRLCELAVTWLTEAFRRGEFIKGEERLAFDKMQYTLADWKGWGYSPEVLWPELLKRIQDEEGMDPWIPTMILADYHEEAGWLARGTGYADDVTDEGWKSFHEHLSVSAQLYRKAYRMHPEYPESARNMIQIIMAGEGGAGETERLWFDRAVAAQFDDMPSYAAYLNSSLPRWGGSHEKMLAFARECLATKRFDTGIPAMYFETLIRIGMELDEPGELFKVPGVYDDVRAMMEGVLQSSETENPKYWKGQYVLAAYWAGDYETAKKQARELGPWLPRQWKRDNPFRISIERFVRDTGLDASIFSVQAPVFVEKTLEYRNPDATNVSLIGDFNRWDPTRHPMVRDDNGTWRVSLKLVADRFYSYKFLVDGVERMDPNVSDTLKAGDGPVGSLLEVWAPKTTTSNPPPAVIKMAPIVSSVPQAVGGTP